MARQWSLQKVTRADLKGTDSTKINSVHVLFKEKNPFGCLAGLLFRLSMFSAIFLQRFRVQISNRSLNEHNFQSSLQGAGSDCF